MTKYGKLFYNSGIGRYDVLFGDGSVYGGFHAGDCLGVSIDGK